MAVQSVVRWAGYWVASKDVMLVVSMDASTVVRLVGRKAD